MTLVIALMLNSMLPEAQQWDHLLLVVIWIFHVIHHD